MKSTQDLVFPVGDAAVELALACADACGVLDRGLYGRRLDELDKSVFDAIAQLVT